ASSCHPVANFRARVDDADARVKSSPELPATAASLGGGHPGGVALCLQFHEGAPVVLRHDLDEGGQRVVPVLEERTGAGAAGQQVVALDQDAQALAVEAQWVAHAVIDDIRRALARPV